MALLQAPISALTFRVSECRSIWFRSGIQSSDGRRLCNAAIAGQSENRRARAGSTQVRNSAASSRSSLTTRRVLPFRALLALSAAAAVVFLRRKRNLQQLRADRGSASFEQGERMSTKMKTIDTHLHVWASPEEAKKFPYFPGQEPTLPGSADILLKTLEWMVPSSFNLSTTSLIIHMSPVCYRSIQISS